MATIAVFAIALGLCWRYIRKQVAVENEYVRRSISMAVRWGIPRVDVTEIPGHADPGRLHAEVWEEASRLSHERWAKIAESWLQIEMPVERRLLLIRAGINPERAYAPDTAQLDEQALAALVALRHLHSPETRSLI